MDISTEVCAGVSWHGKEHSASLRSQGAHRAHVIADNPADRRRTECSALLLAKPEPHADAKWARVLVYDCLDRVCYTATSRFGVDFWTIYAFT
jgi:hypothetical protein